MFLLLLFVVAACGMPSPLDGLNRSGTAGAGGHDFRVNWNLETAQATRMDRRWRPDRTAVMAAAAAAAVKVTGCRVQPGSVAGDISLIDMALDCRVQ